MRYWSIPTLNSPIPIYTARTQHNVPGDKRNNHETTPPPKRKSCYTKLNGITPRPGHYLTTLNKSLPNFGLFPHLKGKRKNSESRRPSLPMMIQFTACTEFTHLLGDQFSKYVHNKANQSRTYAERLDYLRRNMKRGLIPRLKWSTISNIKW